MMTSNMNTTSKIEDKLKYGYDLKNEDNLKNKFLKLKNGDNLI